MPRLAKKVSIKSIIEDSVGEVVSRAAESISRAVVQMVAEELEKQLAVSPGARRAPRRVGGVARPRRGEQITKWIADNRARRVPNFVIEMTGIKTKKKIVAKYGESATFERGKPMPQAA